MAVEFPTFSIIIPTYNRPIPLRACLAEVAQLDYPRDCFEVIVVDDGGVQPLDEIIDSFRHSLTLRLLRQNNAGAGAARNSGIEAATGDVVAFIDDDCFPSKTWLRGMAARHNQAPDCMVGGKTLNALPNNLFATSSQLITDVAYRFYNSNPDDARFIAGNNMMLPRAVLREIGSFDQVFIVSTAEDRELCDRWRSLGKRIIYAPEVTIYHAHHLTLASYWRQHFGYGQGAYYFHRKRRKRRINSFASEIGFHTHLQNWLPVWQVRGWRKPAIFGLILLSQAAVAAGYFYESLSHH